MNDKWKQKSHREIHCAMSRWWFGLWVDWLIVNDWAIRWSTEGLGRVSGLIELTVRRGIKVDIFTRKFFLIEGFRSNFISRTVDRKQKLWKQDAIYIHCKIRRSSMVVMRRFRSEIHSASLCDNPRYPSNMVHRDFCEFRGNLMPPWSSSCNFADRFVIFDWERINSGLTPVIW